MSFYFLVQKRPHNMTKRITNFGLALFCYIPWVYLNFGILADDMYYCSTLAKNRSSALELCTKDGGQLALIEDTRLFAETKYPNFELWTGNTYGYSITNKTQHSASNYMGISILGNLCVKIRIKGIEHPTGQDLYRTTVRISYTFRLENCSGQNRCLFWKENLLYVSDVSSNWFQAVELGVVPTTGQITVPYMHFAQNKLDQHLLPGTAFWVANIVDFKINKGMPILCGVLHEHGSGVNVSYRNCTEIHGFICTGRGLDKGLYLSCDNYFVTLTTTNLPLKPTTGYRSAKHTTTAVSDRTTTYRLNQRPTRGISKINEEKTDDDIGVSIGVSVGAGIALIVAFVVVVLKYRHRLACFVGKGSVNETNLNMQSMGESLPVYQGIENMTLPEQANSRCYMYADVKGNFNAGGISADNGPSCFTLANDIKGHPPEPERFDPTYNRLGDVRDQADPVHVYDSTKETKAQDRIYDSTVSMLDSQLQWNDTYNHTGSMDSTNYSKTNIDSTYYSKTSSGATGSAFDGEPTDSVYNHT